MNTGFFPRFLAELRNRKRGFNSRRLHHFSLGFWISLDPSHQFPALPSILKGKDRNQGANPRKQGSFTGTIDTRTKKVEGRNYRVYRAGYYCPDGKRVMRDCGYLNRAQDILREAAQAFGRSRPDALSFTPEEQRDAEAAMALLAPYNLILYVNVRRTSWFPSCRK